MGTDVTIDAEVKFTFSYRTEVSDPDQNAFEVARDEFGVAPLSAADYLVDVLFNAANRKTAKVEVVSAYYGTAPTYVYVLMEHDITSSMGKIISRKYFATQEAAVAVAEARSPKNACTNQTNKTRVYSNSYYSVYKEVMQ